MAREIRYCQFSLEAVSLKKHYTLISREVISTIIEGRYTEMEERERVRTSNFSSR